MMKSLCDCLLLKATVVLYITSYFLHTHRSVWTGPGSRWRRTSGSPGPGRRSAGSRRGPGPGGRAGERPRGPRRRGSGAGGRSWRADPGGGGPPPGSPGAGRAPRGDEAAGPGREAAAARCRGTSWRSGRKKQLTSLSFFQKYLQGN